MRWLVIVWIMLVASTGLAAETKVFLNGMTCPMCAGKVKDLFENLQGYQVEDVEVVSIRTGEVIVHTKGENKIEREILEKKLKGTDYSLKQHK